MPFELLVVEPYESFRSQLYLIGQEAGWNVVGCQDFPGAREVLVARRPRVIVSNVRLGAYNGIQLAYLAKLAERSTSIVVYGADNDVGLAHDAQEACAFFERERFIPHALTAYLAAASHLPARDRRDPRRPDRRATFRGGRRATDLAILHSSLQPPARPERPGRDV